MTNQNKWQGQLSVAFLLMGILPHVAQSAPEGPSSAHSYQESLLECIAAGDSSGVVAILANKKAVKALDFKKINYETENGDTLLTLAVRKGSVAIVESLLKIGPHPDEQLTQTGRTPFMIATDGQQLDLMKVLIKKGANPNKGQVTGFYPIHVAAALGSVILTEFLLKNGADPMQKDGEGKTPYYYSNILYREKIKMAIKNNGNPSVADSDIYSKIPNRVAQLLFAHGATHAVEIGTLKKRVKPTYPWEFVPIPRTGLKSRNNQSCGQGLMKNDWVILNLDHDLNEIDRTQSR